MREAIDTSKQAMNQDQIRLQSIFHNLSNMHTPAYKRQLYRSSSFETLMNPSAIDQFLIQGSLKESQNPAHLALTDSGFFKVQTQAGIRYTRRGDFQINAKGELTTVNGDLLLGTQGPIQVEGPFQINQAGEVLVNHQKIDQIQIVDFEQAQNLKYLGSGLYASEANPEKSASASILQGYLEESNVKSLEEMSDLKQTVQHFEKSQRILRTADRMQANLISQLGEGNV